VVGANLAGGVPANSGKGALIAVADVTAGQAVLITGSVGGDVGPAFALPAIPFPEPTGLALAPLGFIALTARRRV